MEMKNGADTSVDLYYLKELNRVYDGTISITKGEQEKKNYMSKNTYNIFRTEKLVIDKIYKLPKCLISNGEKLTYKGGIILLGK